MNWNVFTVHMMSPALKTITVIIENKILIFSCYHSSAYKYPISIYLDPIGLECLILKITVWDNELILKKSLNKSGAWN